MKVLLTGGSGFIAAHCLEQLLEHGHNVVTTVRSDDKGQRVLKAHDVSKERLSYVLVEDIAKEGAFDEAVKSDPPFEVVLHTASPFHFNVTDPKKDLLDPAIVGTTGILKAVKASAPSVKRVVITSSFAAILSAPKHEPSYSEKNWNSVTWEQAVGDDPSTTYRASKTFAERAAWEFVEKEKANFAISTICPPLVLGPIVHYLNSLDALNTSNSRIRDIIQGKWKENVPPTGVFLWVDVRDVALAHVKAAEIPEAAGKRFFVTAGHFTNKELIDIVRKGFPQYAGQLISKDAPSDFPKDIFKFDNSRSKETLGLKYRPLNDCIVDLVKSLQAAGL